MERNIGETSAYFTVEAAMILPMTLSVCVMLIYVMFYQYDRCLLEQDMAILAVRGTLMEGNNEEVMESLIQQERQRNMERFPAFHPGEVRMAVGTGKVTVTGEGQVIVPFGDFTGWLGGNSWRIRAEYFSRRNKPVDFIRICRKMAGRKEEKHVSGGVCQKFKL